MKNSYLFSHKWKLIGKVLFLISFPILCIAVVNDWHPDFLNFKVFAPFKDDFLKDLTPGPWEINNLLEEILSIIAIISGLLWCFSKEKIEDEYISNIRKNALIWSVYVNYSIYILATILVYGFAFLNVLMLNVFTLIVVFIIKFEWDKYKLNRSSHEE